MEKKEDILKKGVSFQNEEQTHSHRYDKKKGINDREIIDRLLELPRLTSVPQKRTQLQMSPLWPPHRQKPRQSNPRTAMSKQTVLGAFPNFAKHAEKLSEMKPKKGCTSTPKKQTTLDSFIQLSKRKAVVIDPADVERETYEWNGVVTLQEQLKCEKKKHRVPGTQHTQKQ